MQSSQYRDEVKSLVLRSFLRCGQEEKVQRMTILTDDLVEKNIPLDDLRVAFDLHAQKSAFVPTMSDILNLFQSKMEDEMQREIAEKWVYFLENALHPLSKIEDWAFSARQEIGDSRCYSATAADIPWIKKEFVEIVKMQITGKLKISGDDRNWVRIGGSWAIMPGNAASGIDFKKLLGGNNISKIGRAVS